MRSAVLASTMRAELETLGTKSKAVAAWAEEPWLSGWHFLPSCTERGPVTHWKGGVALTLDKWRKNTLLEKTSTKLHFRHNRFSTPLYLLLPIPSPHLLPAASLRNDCSVLWPKDFSFKATNICLNWSNVFSPNATTEEEKSKT